MMIFNTVNLILNTHTDFKMTHFAHRVFVIVLYDILNMSNYCVIKNSYYNMYSLKQLITFIYISAIVALCLFDSVDIKICISGGIELT